MCTHKEKKNEKNENNLENGLHFDAGLFNVEDVFGGSSFVCSVASRSWLPSLLGGRDPEVPTELDFCDALFSESFFRPPNRSASMSSKSYNK